MKVEGQRSKVNDLRLSTLDLEPYTMKFATVSTLRATTQPALVIGERVHTLPYPDMLAVIAAGAEAASKKAAKESLALDEVKFL